MSNEYDPHDPRRTTQYETDSNQLDIDLAFLKHKDRELTAHEKMLQNSLIIHSALQQSNYTQPTIPKYIQKSLSELSFPILARHLTEPNVHVATFLDQPSDTLCVFIYANTRSDIFEHHLKFNLSAPAKDSLVSHLAKNDTFFTRLTEYQNPNAAIRGEAKMQIHAQAALSFVANQLNPPPQPPTLPR